MATERKKHATEVSLKTIEEAIALPSVSDLAMFVRMQTFLVKQRVDEALSMADTFDGFARGYSLPMLIPHERSVDDSYYMPRPSLVIDEFERVRRNRNAWLSEARFGMNLIQDLDDEVRQLTSTSSIGSRDLIRTLLHRAWNFFDYRLDFSQFKAPPQ